VLIRVLLPLMIAPTNNLELRDFLREVYVPSKLDLSPGWIEQLDRTIGQFSRHLGHAARLADLNDEAVCRFLMQRLAEGLAPITVNGSRAKLLALWRCGWRKRRIDELPRDVPRCREPKPVPRAWNAEEVSRLAGQAATVLGYVAGLPAGRYWSTLVLVVWETGLRIGAVRQMTPDDFLPQGPALLARSTTQKTLLGQCMAIRSPLAAALAEFLAVDPQRELIWPWPYCRRWFFARFRRIVESAGLTANRRGHDLFYRLRRSHLSYVARESLEAARQQAGHASAAVTLRHYIDPLIASQRPAVEMLPKL